MVFIKFLAKALEKFFRVINWCTRTVLLSVDYCDAVLRTSVQCLYQWLLDEVISYLAMDSGTENAGETLSIDDKMMVTTTPAPTIIDIVGVDYKMLIKF